jgi:hypothetical protein
LADDRQVTYVVDKGLIRFAKFAASLFGLFIIIGVSLYFVDVKDLRKDLEDNYKASQDLRKDIQNTYNDSQKLQIDIKAAEQKLGEKLTALKVTEDKITSEANAAKQSAESAKTAYSEIQQTERQARASGTMIEGYKTQVLGIINLTKSPTTSNSSETEKFIENAILRAFTDVLPDPQFMRLKSRITAFSTAEFRRQIFAAENKEILPGSIARSEGDPPVADTAVNTVYDNLQTIHDFYKQIFGHEIGKDVGGILITTIHYGSGYDNLFWSGKQIVVGDGDGRIFRIGAFMTAGALSIPVTHAVDYARINLAYAGQSGALESSFADIVSVLIEQWQKRQSAEDASWLVSAGALVSAKAVALRSLKAPGTAYVDEPTLGRDRQVSDVKHLYTGGDDNGGVHINSGIPSKAFYEVAIRLKGYAWERPAHIWYKAYEKLKTNSTFQDLADATLAVAAESYGTQSEEQAAVRAAWGTVGITPRS